MSTHALVIQLARLGDLIQTLPVLDALQDRHPDRTFDLLCAAPLAELVRRSFPVNHVLPWDGNRCRAWADDWGRDPLGTVQRLQQYIEGLSSLRYEDAYNLNQHERAILAAHLLAVRVTGAGETGPFSTGLGAWPAYLRRVAHHRGLNRIHLADAFCGLCGVRPRGRALPLRQGAVALPTDLEAIGSDGEEWAAVVIGAGDVERCVPPSVWIAWIQAFLSAHSRANVVLIGAGGEREAAHAIQSSLPSMFLGRLWDATGRTTLPQLMTILSRNKWVVGADTGPLHLGTAVGARAIGFYFARARVHETGPYGEGHWVFQHHGSSRPVNWPIGASIELMFHGHGVMETEWELWKSHVDEWGAYFEGNTGFDSGASQRETVWRQLSPWLVPAEHDEYV
jgi:ADP-heptose:LPS heptosyltransferase